MDASDDLFEVDLVPLVSQDELPDLEELRELKSRKYSPLNGSSLQSNRTSNGVEGLHLELNHVVTQDGRIIIQPKVVKNIEGKGNPGKTGIKKKVVRRIYHVPRGTPIEAVVKKKPGVKRNIFRYRTNGTPEQIHQVEQAIQQHNRETSTL